ncbi:hypothetical protein QL285_058960 [Trifolium repens]|nr:hypothetical protein QL285_058960 [Trifolium repens]
MDKDRRVIKSNKSQEKKKNKKKKKMKIQHSSKAKTNPQKMKASTSAPVRGNYQTRSKTQHPESLSESESDWDSDWKEFLSTYVPPKEDNSSSSFGSNQLDLGLVVSDEDPREKLD